MNRVKAIISPRMFIGLLFIFLLTYVGCGNNANESTVISSVISTGTPAIEGNELVVDSDDSYYVALEKKLNEELDINRAPDKCAAQGLTKIVLNCTTDEIQTCSTYDLSKAIVTAYFSDKTAEVVTPTWSIYSGGGTLDGTIYMATNKPAIIVFKALYTENGISKLALFRLTVTGLTSISLSKTTDEIMLPATYDLSNELIITAKLSNGTTKTIIKGDSNLLWSLASGAGTLADGVYTPSAKVETAVFNASYSEAGVTKTAQFKLKVTGLSSLILSKTTDEINSCETYDLTSKIVVSNKLSNGSINDITSSQNLAWTLSSGSGILANKIYTAPAKAETAVFTASYTEAGITKTAQFRLKVTGLSSVDLDKTTDEIMLPATYDLASEIHATAKFSDGESKSVDLIWSLSYGSGVLSGSIYTPAPKPETAVFIGSYTENGITKTAQFRLKVIGLSSLALSKTTDEVASCTTYDLSQIVVSDKLSNGTINNITNSTTWKLISGFGTLSDKTYTAPARAETAVFMVSYTEAGITKTAQFRLKIIALASISLSKTTDEAQILAQYDLATNIVVTAKLSNGQINLVSGNDPNLKWTLSYGSGVLSGTLYTPSEKIETAILTATFAENGVAQSVQLRLKSTATLRGKIELVGLTLEKTTDSVRIGQTYDLSKLIAIAKFADKTTAEVSLTWIVSSGGGFIAGTSYTAPNNVATVKLMGTYKALDGSAKSAYFTLTIYGNEIYGNQGMVTMEGAKFHLTNGVTVEIPENSVSEPFEINFENNKSFSQFEQLPGQTIFSCNFTKNVNEVILKIPVDSNVTTEDVSLACFMPDLDKAVILTPAIKNSEAVFFIGGGSEQVTAPLRAPSTGDRRVYGFSTFIIYVNDNKAKQPFITVVDKTPEEKQLIWPAYMQLYSTCYATTWLMLMEGYKELRATKELNPQFDSIFDIVDALMKNGVTIHDDAKDYGGAESYDWSTSTQSRDDGTEQFFINLIQTSFNVYAGKEKVSSLTSYYNQMTVKSYFCNNFDALANLVPTLLSRKIPIKVDTAWHSMLILGYEANNVVQNGLCDYSKIKFWVSNPVSLNRKECLTFNEFIEIMIPKNSDGSEKISISNKPKIPYTCYAIDKIITPLSFHTIHLASGPGFNINFKDSNAKDIMTSYWNINTNLKKSSIEWQTAEGESLKLQTISLNKALVFNTGNSKNIYLKSTIYKNTVIIAEERSATFNADNKTKTAHFSALAKNFLSELKRLKISSGEFLMRVELKEDCSNPDTDPTLDRFEVNFNYHLPKSLFIELPKESVGLGSTVSFKAMYGLDDTDIIDVSGKVEWFVDGVKMTNYQNYVASAVGIRDISAILKSGTVIYNETITDTIEVGVKLTVIPELSLTPVSHPGLAFNVKRFKATVNNNNVTDLLTWGAIPPSQEARIIEDTNSIGVLEKFLEIETNYTVQPAGYTLTATAVYSGVECTTEIKLNRLTIDHFYEIYDMSKAGQSVKLEASFDGQPASANWQVLGGSALPGGDYILPDAPGIYIIKATYNDSDAYAVIRMIGELKISPALMTLNADTTCQFYAQIDGATQETSIIWSATGGGITDDGYYTAPSIAGTYIIKASFGTFEATAEITVPIRDLKISPPSAVLNRSQQMTFKALIGDTTQETGITWSVVSASGGSITQTGVYTAPAQWGNYIVKAACQGIEVTAEVRVNDERVKLNFWQSWQTPKNPINNVRMPACITSEGFIPSTNIVNDYCEIPVYIGGTITDTIELIIKNLNGRGKFEFTGNSYNSYNPPKPWDVCQNFKFTFTGSTDQIYYDTNEILYMEARCKENSSAIATAELLLLRPVLDTVENFYNQREYSNGKTCEIYQAIVYTNPKYSVIYRHGHYKRWSPYLPNRLEWDLNYYCNEWLGNNQYYYAGGLFYNCPDLYNMTCYRISDNTIAYRASRTKIGGPWTYY